MCNDFGPFRETPVYLFLGFRLYRVENLSVLLPIFRMFSLPFSLGIRKGISQPIEVWYFRGEELLISLPLRLE